jgi:ABC-type cobalamin/Fe3+-siderophores transport system ATPase subunit
MHKFIIPNKTGIESPNLEFTTENNIVVIGANGSGKSRFGAYIDQINTQIDIHRISAQKILQLVRNASYMFVDAAENTLFYGGTEAASAENKGLFRFQGKWQGNPTINPQNDYSSLLSLLFAKSIERDAKYVEESKLAPHKVDIPKAPIDIIIQLWSELMPQRLIRFEKGSVIVNYNGADYNGSEMSDGERAILYLIGQCICAPKNSLLIIDEPENHIHKSLISKLWDKIEEICPDKLFLYITHDLEFAASRADAHKFWIKEYQGGTKWIWDEINEDEGLPENLLIEILGNRKQVIFCEGEKASHDNTIYQLVYPNFHIIPRGGGDKVIEATKAMNENALMHHLKAYGFIDSDYKEYAEKIALSAHNIHTLPVAEIENLFCLEPILKIVAQHLGLNPDEKVTEVTAFLIQRLTNEFELQVTNKAAKIVEYRLGAFSKKSPNKDGIEKGIEETINNININVIYSESEQLFQQAINEKNLSKILLLYNRKSLVDQISPIFGLAKKEYSNLVFRLLKGNKQGEIVTAMKAYLPTL